MGQKKGTIHSGSFKKGHKILKGSEKGWFKEGHIPWIKGKHHSKETIKDLSLFKLGKHYSTKTEFKKGIIPWNKGLKGVMPSPWNKGIKLSDKHKEKLKIAKINYKPNQEGLREYYKTNEVWNKGLKSRIIKGNPTKRINKKKRPIAHIVWCYENDIHRIPDECIIHHIDGNQFNNNIKNLQLMTKDFHSKLHNQYNKILLAGGVCGNIIF